MMALLDVRDLHAGFGAAAALRGVTLAVERGESVAVLGPNGAGKSTLLRTLMGRVTCTAGSVLWDNIDCTNDPTDVRVGRGMSLCPEGRQLFPAMSVQDNLLLGAYLASRRELRIRLDDIYHRFPLLYERRSHLAGGFSGGEQQLIAVGRALMSRPRLLLMDEPSSGLSPIAIGHLCDILGEVRDMGMAILVVEQNVRLATEMSRRYYVLNRGVIEAAGATADLVEKIALADTYLGGEVSKTKPPSRS
jgi:branched-chain amino acid transport system ATP-binding protein